MPPSEAIPYFSLSTETAAYSGTLRSVLLLSFLS